VAAREAAIARSRRCGYRTLWRKGDADKRSAYGPYRCVSPQAARPSLMVDIPAWWRAMEDFFQDPFAARGALERWFGDFSSSRFEPRIDVVDEGKILRVTVELPGMEREDLIVSIEDGALV
jgi:HSP20 family protein